MPRSTGLNKTLAFRVADADYKTIEQAMERERRTESDICRALLLRGIAAYKRDGRIFEPEEARILRRAR